MLDCAPPAWFLIPTQQVTSSGAQSNFFARFILCGAATPAVGGCGTALDGESRYLWRLRRHTS